MPPGAAEFAVGHHLKTGSFLLFDHATNFLILDPFKYRGIDGAPLKLEAGFLQCGRPQKAADDIGSEWGMRLRHEISFRETPTRWWHVDQISILRPLMMRVGGNFGQ